jgi:hypothetical protein
MLTATITTTCEPNDRRNVPPLCQGMYKSGHERRLGTNYMAFATGTGVTQRETTFTAPVTILNSNRRIDRPSGKCRLNTSWRYSVVARQKKLCFESVGQNR